MFYFFFSRMVLMVRLMRARVELKGSHVFWAPPGFFFLHCNLVLQGTVKLRPKSVQFRVYSSIYSSSFSRGRKPGKVKGYLPLRVEKQKLKMLSFWHHRCETSFGLTLVYQYTLYLCIII